MPWYVVVVGAAVAALGIGVACVILRRRRRRPLTAEEKLAAARSAARAIRRSSPRPNRDHFEAGDGVPGRHAGAIAENSAYGDAANFGSGGSQP